MRVQLYCMRKPTYVRSREDCGMRGVLPNALTVCREAAALLSVYKACPPLPLLPPTSRSAPALPVCPPSDHSGYGTMAPCTMHYPIETAYNSMVPDVHTTPYPR